MRGWLRTPLSPAVGRSWVAVLASIAVAALAISCVDDVVLPGIPSDAVCGNGVLESGEACDVDSPGCASCAVVPNWTCTPTGCTETCGDGVVGNGIDCGAAQRSGDCDMTGYWAARETDFTRDAIIGALQTSSNWFLYRFEQSGDEFQVVESLDCGVHVTGSVTVDSSAGTLRSSLYANRMDGKGTRPVRRGTSKPSGSGCAVTLDRWYKVRGVTDAYLPTDFSTRPTLASLPPLPKVDDPVNGVQVPAGTEDPDGDGVAGVSYRITGFVSGVRNAAQRDWKEYATTVDGAVPRGALVLKIPGAFDLEESVLRVSDCDTSCALIASAARSAQDKPGQLTLSFVGRTFGSPRVSAVVAGVPRANVDTDLSTCANVRLLVPHESASN